MKRIYILLICILTVVIPLKVNANEVMIQPNQLTLGLGVEEKLNYTLATGLNNKDIVWVSSNPSVATVDNGVVTTHTEGSTLITAYINEVSSNCMVVVKAITGITLNKHSLSMLINTSETLKYSVSPSNIIIKNVGWKSSDPSVVTVENGNLIAHKVGTATITISSYEYNDQATVTVVDTVKVAGISLNKKELTIKEKTKSQLTATLSPSNATDKKITWRSSNTNIVTVDQSGNLTAINPGTATITVVSNDGGYVAVCKITVEAISKKVTSISLNQKELSMISGEKQTLKVTIKPDYAENKNVTWLSSDDKIATVNNGEITAINPGTAEIKVTSIDGNLEAICKVTVLAPPPQSISFADEVTTIYLDNELTLKPILTPKNSVIEKPIWTSSNEEIATVDNGIIKGLSLGETTITIANEDKTLTATILVKVVNKPKEKLNITIEGHNLNFDPNVTNYTLTIGNENTLTIKTNVSEDKVNIKGNKNLKNGSIVTITVDDEEKVTYIINIKQKQNYTIYFIAIISVLLLLNLIRILLKNKKKKN